MPVTGSAAALVAVHCAAICKTSAQEQPQDSPSSVKTMYVVQMLRAGSLNMLTMLLSEGSLLAD